MKYKNLLNSIFFILLMILNLFILDRILIRKSLNKTYNNTIRIGGLKNEPKNSIDILILGSSHAYRTFNHEILKKETGLSSYVYGSSEQPIGISYHAYRQFLKYQLPKVIVLETFMLEYEDGPPKDNRIRDFLDFIPLSKVKSDAIQDLVKKDKYLHYFNFIRYKDRWKELNKNDFKYIYFNDTDPFKGVSFHSKISKIEKPSKSVLTDKKIKLSEYNSSYLDKIINLAKENNSRLIFLRVPYQIDIESNKKSNGVKEYCKANNIEFYDLNEFYDEIGLDFEVDFADHGHLNKTGADKVTLYFTKILKKNKASINS